MILNIFRGGFNVENCANKNFLKGFLIILFAVLLLASDNKSWAQTFNPGKGIIWELSQPSEPRLKFRFGTTGINIGGYEGTTLVIENLTDTELYVDTKLTFTDFCGGTKTNSIKVSIKPHSKIGGSTWMGGSEQHDYKTTCTQRKEYDKQFVTKIANATLEIVSVRETASKSTASGTGNTNSNSGNTGTTNSGNSSTNSAGNATGSAGNSASNSQKSCPTYGFKFSNDPSYNCVALDWWSLSTKVNMVDAAGNFSQPGGPDAVKFTIQFRKQGDVNWISEVRNNSGKNTHLLTGLDACTKYEVRLISTCENNVNSEPTNIIRFTTACKAPSALLITNIKDFSAQVEGGRETEMSYPCDPATTKIRIVEYKSGGSVWEEVVCNFGSPCVLNALVPGTIYRVRSRYKYGKNLFSEYTNETSFTTTGQKPNPCDGTNTSAGSAGGSGTATGTLAIPAITEPANGQKITGYYVELAWNGVIGATSYELQVATKADFSDAVSFTTMNTKFPPYNYGKAETYYWRVRAKGPNGKLSYWSPPATFLVN